MDILFYLFILFAKITEVSISTVRIVLITKGERKIGALIGFFEILLWLFIASNVIKNISEDPLKAVFYALGFAIGNYVGSILEEKIGLGLSEIQVIVMEEHGILLAEEIREKGFAVTLVRGEGKNRPRAILMMFLPRKRVREVVKYIQNKQENAVITVSETKPIYGGYGMLMK
jgi:uncharacterized protein YebE (UPF0316 family)